MSMNVFIGTSLKDQCSNAGRSKFGSTPIKIMDIAFIKKRRDTPSDTFSKELNYIHKGDGRGSQGVPLKSLIIKHKIKFGVSCSWPCPETSMPSAKHLAVALFFSSTRSNVRGEVEGP